MKRETGESRTTIFVRDSDSASLAPLRARVEKLCPGQECSLTGSLIAYADFTERIPSILLESFLTSLALVIGVILFLAWQEQVPHAIALVLSSLWGPAFMLLSMALLGLPVNLMTCMFASVLVGLAGDNAIQFILNRSDLEGGISERGGASLLCCGMMSVTSLLFCLSYFEPPHVFGVMLPIGLISCTLGDIWLLKGLMRKI